MTTMTLEYEAHSEQSSLARLRRTLGAWLTDQGTTPDTVVDLQLVVTELVANAEEACVGVDLPISIHCEVADRRVHLSVQDHGPSVDLPDLHADDDHPVQDRGVRDRRLRGPALRGRGLAIVRYLTDSIVIKRVGSATVVRVTADFR